MFGYCSDDDRPRTPGLQPVVVKYTPPPSPISFIPRRRPMTDSDPGDEQQSRKRGRSSRDKPKPSQGDVVLLAHLDPNRPDIAAAAASKTLLSSESASERGGTNDDEDSRMDEDDDAPSTGEARSSRLSPLRQVQQGARGLPPASSGEVNVEGQSRSSIGTDAEMPDVSPERDAAAGSSDLHARTDTHSAYASSDPSQRHSDASRRSILTQGQWNASGPEQPIRAVARSAFRPKSSITLPHISDSITSSPKLAPHIMLGPHKSPINAEHPLTVPLSPPPPIHQEQSLPSVQHLVRVAETQDEAIRNQRPRTASLSSASSVFGGNAPSQTSAPPASATSAHFFVPSVAQPPTSTFQLLNRTQTDPTPLPLPIPSTLRHASTNPADFAMHSGSNGHYPHEQPLHSTSSLASTSTAGATPGSMNDAPTPSDDRSSTLSLPLSPDRIAQGNILPCPQGPTAVGGGPTLYRCNYPGCRAPPFQTPYLLNSHRNVHSSDRPYFCPRKDCPRSLPGKGFKRKNEMLRHGLVHDSPGYVCPFCSPEKEHRYPRPDNLQRHVKMHHEDVDPEDARLREVLGQRRTMAGSNANMPGSSKTSEGTNVSTIKAVEGRVNGIIGPGPSSSLGRDVEHTQVGPESMTSDSSATPRGRRKKAAGSLGR